MAKNQSTYTLKIDAELGNLQKTLNEAKNSLSGLMASDKAPKGLEKAFEKINQLLGQISDKSGNALDLKGLAATGKDLTAIQESFRTIMRLLGNFNDLSDDIKFSFLSAEEQKQITNITKSLENYEKTIADTTKKLKDLEAAQKTLGRDEAQLGKAKKNVNTLTNRKGQKTAELEGARGKLAAIEGIEGANPEKIAKYKAEIIELEAVIKGLDGEIALANEELTKAQQVYDASAKAVTGLKNEIDRANKGSLKELKDQAKAAGVSLEGLNGHDATTQMKMLNDRLTEFKNNALKGAEPAFNAIIDGCNEAKEAAKGLGEGVEAASESVKAMDEATAQREAFEGKIKQFLGLQGAAQVMRAALRDAMATITELDATMTEMAVVTDLTVGDYWDQLPEYSKRASELGVSINSAYKAATLYYQQGLKTNEVTAISAETLKMAKIAGLDAAEATDKMTAALRGFNMELNETSARRVSDVYSELAAITAADVDEISTAMTKTASIASSAGMEFETTAAFLSQIIETTRESAETAGTALKTVIARFQELKKNPNEIGEVEGEIVDANAIETALRSVGVSLRDAQGQFRELDDVFLELSGKWDSLDKNTQRYIATIAAGSRQQSRFIAMMSDYKRTQELVTAANTSAGASNKQFEKTMDSLEAKVEKLKNAWHEFTMGIMNSDLVKFGVDVLTKFLEVINKATSAFGGLGGSLVKVAGVFSIFKLGQKLFEKFMNPLKKFFVDVVVEARKAGEESAKAYADGVKKAIEENKEKPQQEEEQKKTLKEIALDKTGAGQFQEGFRAASNKRDELLNKRKDQKERYDKAAIDFEEVAANFTQDSEEYQKALEEMIEANEEWDGSLELTEEELEEVRQAGVDGMQDVQAGMQKMGSTAIAAGAGVSMLGGLLSSLGLEEVGQGLVFLGNGLTIVGTSISAIGTLIPVISKIAVSAGISVQAAWWWVVLIVAAVAALVVGVIAIANAIKNASPEAKLEKAREATDAAAEAAEHAKEAYEGLANSFDQLKDKYASLDTLRKGTDEWKNSVEELNNSILDLVTKYPELASLVKTEDGVLTLDVDSDAAQNVLKEYSNQATIAKAGELGGKISVVEAQQQVDFANLSATKKITRNRWWNPFAQDFASDYENIEDRQLEAGNSEVLQKATEALAAEYMKNGHMNESEMSALLQSYGVLETEADMMAEAFSENTSELREFAESTALANEQQKANAKALTTQALSMIDLSRYNEDQINQMSSVYDIEKVDREIKEQANLYDQKSSSEQDEALEEYAKELYGETAEVGKDGITYYDNGVEKTIPIEKEQLAYQMQTARATEEMANEMKNLPAAMSKASLHLGEAGETFNKVFTQDEGRALNASELTKLTEKELREVYEQMGDEGKAIWTSVDEFMTDYNNRLDKAAEAFDDATTNMNNIGIAGDDESLFGKMSAEAAEAWSKNLMTLNMSGGDVTGLQNSLSTLLNGKTEEQVNAIIGQINAMDMTDIDAWQELENFFETMNIPTDGLQNFIDKGIEVSNAIEKIDFENFNKSLNDTYTLIQKIKEEGSRKFDEEGYNELIAANKNLEKDFRQIGDKFVYVGTSLDNLKDALEKNTISNLEEANRQLDSLIKFSTIAEGMESNNVDAMDETQLREYLIAAMSGAVKQGVDVADLGIAGFSNTTDLFAEGVDKAQLLKWAQAFAATAGKKSDYEEDKKTNMREADILGYIYKNSVMQNAEMAMSETNPDALTKYAEAVMRQAIESGGVSESMIGKLSTAIKEGSPEEIKEITKQVAESADKIIEENEGRDAMSDLIDRVTDALYDQSQKEIDKLQEIKDATETANANLISKLQEQIDEQRQQRQKEEAEKNIANLQQKAAYLGMDTSGGNALAMLDLDKQIADAEQDYQDSLIDQAIQKLQDSNEQAAEQRQRQIDLAQAQLDYDKDSGKLAEQAQQVVQDSLNKINSGLPFNETQIGTLLKTSETEGMNELTQSAWGSQLQNTAVQAANWFANNGNAAPKEAVSNTEENTTGESGGSNNAQLVQNKNSALVGLQNEISNRLNSGQSLNDLSHSKAYSNAATAWEAAEGDRNGFGDEVNKLKNEAVENYVATQASFAISGRADYFNQKSGKEFDMVLWGGDKAGDFDDVKTAASDVSSDVLNTVWNSDSGIKAQNGAKFVYYKGQVYVQKDGGSWYKIAGGSQADVIKYAKDIGKNKYGYKFKSGGLADFTGPAWLDGTPSRPEYVLNPDQTERFFTLIDVLKDYDTSKDGQSARGDNYFDININVDKLENDYDVEQVADKIRRMIYDDATYRNVNAINHIR